MHNQRPIVLNPLFLSDSFPSKKDKSKQQFERFLLKARIKRTIKKYRDTENIFSDEMVKMFSKCREALTGDGPDQKYFKQEWAKAETAVNRKAKLGFVHFLLTLDDKPLTWSDSLVWYLFTDEVKFLAKKIYSTVDHQRHLVIVEVSPDAGIRDMIKHWKYIQDAQQIFQGNNLKRKHMTDNSKGLEDARNWVEYKKEEVKEMEKEFKDPATGKIERPLKEAQLDLVDRYDETAFDIPEKKERILSKVRKNYQRYAKYLK